MWFLPFTRLFLTSSFPKALAYFPLTPIISPIYSSLLHSLPKAEPFERSVLLWAIQTIPSKYNFLFAVQLLNIPFSVFVDIKYQNSQLKVTRW